MSYIRLYETSDGESHFQSCETAAAPMELEGGNMPMGMSDPVKVGQMTFFHLPRDWVQEWHRAPQRQFVLIHRGVMRLEASDGEVRRIGAGEVLLVEDVTEHADE